MNKITKRLTALLLSLSICIGAAAMVQAETEEVYLADMRIVYADTAEAAKETLAGTEFEDYTVLDANLNNGTDSTGAWIAYSTTSEIDNALTDVCAMFMNGGYREGNYRAMIEKSRKEYEAMSETYLDAIRYFEDAYNAGDFLAECAFRQLNFYCDKEDHDGATLGDLFVGGIDAAELAVMFMEGNTYAMDNVRTLLAQGVSYNDDGLTYLEKVAYLSFLMDAEGVDVFSELEHFDDFEGLALTVAGTVITFGRMFRELEGVEEELDYSDDKYTDAELEYLEYMTIATGLRAVKYGEGTLYDFCLSYTLDEEELESLYPLVAALNEGQVALTKVCHYYDVVRYSMTELPEELMDENISELEETYGEYPFDIYTGVDRSVYYETYALTSEAYRADAATEKGFLDTVYSDDVMTRRWIEVGVGLGGAAIFAYALFRSSSNDAAIEAATNAASAAETALRQRLTDSLNAIGSQMNEITRQTYDGILQNIMLLSPKLHPYVENSANMTFIEKFQVVNTAIMNGDANTMMVSKLELDAMNEAITKANHDAFVNSGQDMAANTTHNVVTLYSGTITASLYFVGGAMMLWSAISYLISVIDYLIPDYSPVPAALVDMRETADGDRYIKYDAVREAEERDGETIPADTNVYKAEKWIALYTTDSYEAGRPLLAEFNLSSDNMYAPEGYLPVHLFGEEVCYNLNKYNHDSESESVYLSVRQSEKNKTAVSGVPEVVGSMIGGGYMFLGAGMGLLLGAGVSIGVTATKKKKAGTAE